MKPSYDTAFLEIVHPDAHGIGDLVVTTLTNDYMPLLRYRIGDLAEQHVQPYGNHFTVHGRARDALTAADGRRVTTWQVDQCFIGRMASRIMNCGRRKMAAVSCVSCRTAMGRRKKYYAG